ncbi:hypothetical protein DMENIID0001_052230 [Sergentomyia squamirostris]
MQLMIFNSLLMFDIVFVFFLFLVGVTCLVYYLPPTRRYRRAHMYHQNFAENVHITENHTVIDVDDGMTHNISKKRNHGVEGARHVVVDIDGGQSCRGKSISSSVLKSRPSKCCYVKAKGCDVNKECTGPVDDV